MVNDCSTNDTTIVPVWFCGLDKIRQVSIVMILCHQQRKFGHAIIVLRHHQDEEQNGFMASASVRQNHICSVLNKL